MFDGRVIRINSKIRGITYFSNILFIYEIAQTKCYLSMDLQIKELLCVPNLSLNFKFETTFFIIIGEISNFILTDHLPLINRKHVTRCKLMVV